MRYTRMNIITTENEKFVETCSIILNEDKMKKRAADHDYDNVRAYLSWTFDDYSFNELCDIIPDRDDGVLSVRHESSVEEEE